MPPITRHQSLNTLASLIIFFAASGVQAQATSAAWLSVDMPHGGCNLTVHQDNTASIHFGAMPKWVRVNPSTFNFEQLAKDLQAKSYPQSAERPSGVPVGSVSLPTSKNLLFIHDEALVRSLLQRAWDARVPPSTTQEIEDYNWVAKACSLP